MSRTMAKILGGFVDIATMPMNARQKGKTVSRLAQNLQNSELKEVQTKYGPLKFFSLRGSGVVSAVERFHEDEPETLEWIDEYIKPNDTLWDIGANIGLYSIYAAKKEGVKVIAFEPSGLNFSLLVEHIALNDLGDSISPLCLALSNETKLENLNMVIFEPGAASNAVGGAGNQFGEFKPAFTQATPAMKADDFCSVFGQKTPDHVKLDVDGIEEFIIAGMQSLLPKIKTIVVEVEGDNAGDQENKIVGPIIKAGFEEDMSHRQKGSGRNRLYIK